MTEPAHELLARVGIFSSLSEEERRAVAALCRERFYHKNQSLFFEGDPGGMLHIVVSGRVKAVMLDEEGHELILSVMGPGEVLGEVTLIDGGPRSATVTAVDDTTTLTLGRPELLRLIRQNPGLADSLLVVVCSRLRRVSRLLWEVLFLDVEARLCNALLELGRKEGWREGGETRFVLAMSRQDLASMIGASREATTRALRTLQDRCLIRIEGRHVVLSRVLEELCRNLQA